jgi:RNA polymerase sigma-70 factor (ECF subfamily)
VSDQLTTAPGPFAEIYDRYFPDIYRYIAGRLGTNVAEDLTADT